MPVPLSLPEAVVIGAHAALFVVAVILVAIDARDHRLPDAVVLPTLLGVVLAVAAEAVWVGDGGRLLAALGGAVGLGSFYAVLRMLSSEGMGGGDVKLAAVVGAVLGWHGAQALLIGSATAFVLGAAYALLLLAQRKADRSTRIAFGPWMIMGAVIGIAAA